MSYFGIGDCDSGLGLVPLVKHPERLDQDVSLRVALGCRVPLWRRGLLDGLCDKEGLTALRGSGDNGNA